MTEKELKIKQIYAELQDTRIRIAKERGTKYGSVMPIMRINYILDLRAKEEYLVRELAQEFGLFNFSLN